MNYRQEKRIRKAKSGIIPHPAFLITLITNHQLSTALNIWIFYNPAKPYINSVMKLKNPYAVINIF